MSIHPAEAIVVTLFAVPTVAVGVGVGDPAAFNPLYAGFLGAVLASMRQGHAGLQDANLSFKRGLLAALKWFFTLMSGACATAFGSPAFCQYTGLEDNHTMTLIYFGLGLIGSQIVDQVIMNGSRIGTKLFERAGIEQAKQ